jgi:hypothetical protein
MRANGIKFPSRLGNISKLRTITIATRITSTRITRAVKLTAICSGVVNLNFPRYNRDARKMTSAPMAGAMGMVSSELTTIPMVAAHKAELMKACSSTTAVFFRFIFTPLTNGFEPEGHP